MWPLLFLIMFLACLPTAASGAGVAVGSCTAANASVSSTTQVVVIANCSIVAGPQGVIYAVAQAETQCGTTATEGVQLLAGTSVPTLGSAPPGGTTAMTPLLHQNGCNSRTLVTSISGLFFGTPGTFYYVAVTLSTSNGAQSATWNNQSIKLLTY